VKSGDEEEDRQKGNVIHDNAKSVFLCDKSDF
jgi:hypothetical protein